MNTTNNMQPLTVVIVEDDHETLEHMVRIVKKQARLQVVHQASTFKDAEPFLANNQVDILLTDLGLPDGSGIDLIRLTYGKHPNTMIMVLSAFGDEENVITAIMAGAKGYLLKNDDTQEISASLEQLIDGGSPISASIARYLLVQLRGKQDKPKEKEAVPSLLTPRETEVLELIAMGYRNNEIAEKLFISYHTVVNHIRNVYEKLAVSSRSQAIHKASQIGLLRPQ